MGNVRIPRQQRSHQTREKIKRAALALFSSAGIHGTNSKEIAKKAGVSTGSFYSYFKNKKQLLLEILEDFLNQAYSVIWKDIGTYRVDALTRENVRSIIENVFAAYDIAPGFLSQTHALRYSDPDINRVYERERSREVEQIMTLIKANRERLNIRDPYATAIIVHNAVEHVAHTAKFIGPQIDETRLIEALTDIIYSYFSRMPDSARQQR
ncbi:MAG: TetR family transcriptional regulator [Desulfococcus sp. 4484_241]|nr:MAG: TetR family transcriptional regulator [Desulfococcus sp. 4484_241]